MTCFNIDGKTVRQYCMEKGLKYMNFYYWMDKGDTVEEALRKSEAIKERGFGKNIKHKYKGMSLSQYCEKIGVCYNSVIKRVCNGEDIKQALYNIKNKVRKKIDPKYKYKGVGLYEFCHKNKISYNAIYYRMLKGYSVERAVNCYLSKNKL